jgi:hypothetical protein
MVWSRKLGCKTALVVAVTLLSCCSTFIQNASAVSWGWTGFAGVVPSTATSNLTGVQNYRFDSIPSNIPTGAGYCSTLLGHSGDGSSQPFVYQTLVFSFIDYTGGSDYNYFGTIHQCEGYEWYLFLQETITTGGTTYISPIGSVLTSGSTANKFYEYVNNSSLSDVMAAQINSTIWWTTPQYDRLGTSVAVETLSTAQNAVTTYQVSQLNYDPNFAGWTSFSMNSSDIFNNGATNSSGHTAMCSYVVSPPGSTVANLGENTSNMTNCT